MADNPVETAAAELKKLLAQLQKVMQLMESLEKAKIAEDKAIKADAKAAHKEMVERANKQDVGDRLHALQKAADGTHVDNQALLKQVEDLKSQIDDLVKEKGLDLGEVDVGELNEIVGDDTEIAFSQKSFGQKLAGKNPRPGSVLDDTRGELQIIQDANKNDIGNALNLAKGAGVTNGLG